MFDTMINPFFKSPSQTESSQNSASKPQAIAASIEVSPKQACESPDIEKQFPANTRVYITDMGPESGDQLIAGAERIAKMGYRPIPHFAARRMPSKALLNDRLQRLTENANVKDVLVIGGGLDRPAGEFDSTMALLNTGLFEKYGITHMGVAGHPEGSPDFTDAIAHTALLEKQDFASQTGIELRIVTQFGFDSDKFVQWAEGMKKSGIDIPIHLGVAGPAKLTTLVKYAAMCGVGNSIQFIKKRASAVTTLISGFNADDVVNPIERHVNKTEHSAIAQIHVFPFGGVKKSTEWLKERGSW